MRTVLSTDCSRCGDNHVHVSITEHLLTRCTLMEPHINTFMEKVRMLYGHNIFICLRSMSCEDFVFAIFGINPHFYSIINGMMESFHVNVVYLLHSICISYRQAHHSMWGTYSEQKVSCVLHLELNIWLNISFRLSQICSALCVCVCVYIYIVPPLSPPHFSLSPPLLLTPSPLFLSLRNICVFLLLLRICFSIYFHLLVFFFFLCKSFEWRK